MGLFNFSRKPVMETVALIHRDAAQRTSAATMEAERARKTALHESFTPGMPKQRSPLLEVLARNHTFNAQRRPEINASNRPVSQAQVHRMAELLRRIDQIRARRLPLTAIIKK